MTNAALQLHTAVTHVPIEPIEEEFSQYFWSAFGFLLALYAAPQSTLGRVLAESSEPVTYKLSAFAPYTSAPTDRNQEPLFAHRTWKKVVEHNIFGPGTALYRKTLDSGAIYDTELSNGTPVIVVQYGDIERTLVIDAARWITPLASIEKVKAQPVTGFTLRDGSTAKSSTWFRLIQRVEIGANDNGPIKKMDVVRPVTFKAEEKLSSAPWLKRGTNSSEMPECFGRRLQRKFTPYNPAWDKLRAKALDHKFTGFKNFCPNCYEAVVYGLNDTVFSLTKGVYRSQNHECGVTRVEMIPAIKAVRKNARKTTREGCNNRRLSNTQCTHHRRYDDVKPGKEMEGGVELPEYFEKHVSIIGGFNAIVKLETALLKADCSKRADSRAFELWEADQSEKQIPKTNISCQHCDTSIARRKGSKHCSDNCRKAAHKASTIQ